MLHVFCVVVETGVLTVTREEHANSLQKGHLTQPGPFYCEVTLLPTEPPKMQCVICNMGKTK